MKSKNLQENINFRNLKVYSRSIDFAVENLQGEPGLSQGRIIWLHVRSTPATSLSLNIPRVSEILRKKESGDFSK